MPPPNNGNKKHTAGGKNNRNNNRKWNRKRKVEEKRQKAANRNEGKDFKNNDGYHVAIPKNVRMQVYYALQGLHNFRRDENGTNFVPNVSKEEKETERQLFMSYLRTILPASFRIANDSHSLFRDKFISQMEGYAGKPLEIQIPKDKIPLLRNITDVPSKPPVVANGSDAPLTKKDSNNEEEEYITKTIPPVERIPYIPHAYQLSLDRRTLRKNPSLTEFHNWLKIASDSGFITRQETVSAIPPVALQIEPHHLVLDMCAAPGSKTCQILETVGDIAPGGKEPQGCVVANDVDEKRAYMLVRQLKRLNSPAVFVTSVDARFFPGTEVFDRVLCDVPCSGDGTVRKNPGIWRFWNQNGSLSLHRLQLTIAMRGAQLLKPGGKMVYSTCSLNPIENEAVVAELLRQCPYLQLVDVRSTMPGIVARPGMTTWKVVAAEKRDKNWEKKNCPRMVKRRREWEEKNGKDEKEGSVGGEKVEADDKMDVEPSEKTQKTEEETKADNDNVPDDNKNEAEIQPEKPAEVTALSEDPTTNNNKDKADFDEFPTSLWDDPQNLIARAEDLGMTLFASPEDVTENFKSRVKPSCFPPTPQELETMGLERCMRVLPQDMDTGGFFIAMLEKKDGGGGENDGMKKMTEMAIDEVEKEKKEGGSVEADEITEGATDKGNQKDESDKSGDKLTADSSMPDAPSQPQDSTLWHKNSRKPKKGGDLGNSPFIPPPDALFEELISFYGLTPSFPRAQIAVRSCGENKVLYFLTSTVAKLLAETDLQKRVTVINSGSKVFVKNSDESGVRYRVNQDGVQYLAPYMTKRYLVASADDFKKCATIGTVKVSDLSTEFAAMLQELSIGSFVIALKGFEEDWGKKIMMVYWRCRSDTIASMVGKVDMEGIWCKLKAVGAATEEEGWKKDDKVDKKGTATNTL